MAGRVDETLAICGDWSDIDLANVATSLTWHHTAHDRNAPLSAARRLVERLPNAELVIWPDDDHLAAYHRDAEILDELLTYSHHDLD